MSELVRLDTENIVHFDCAKGDVFDITIPFTDDNDQPFDFTGYTISGSIKKQHDGPVFIEFKESDDSITIEDNEVNLYQAAINIPQGVYIWELKMEKDGVTERIYKGTIQVNP